jgi:hypothetical protein
VCGSCRTAGFHPRSSEPNENVYGRLDIVADVSTGYIFVGLYHGGQNTVVGTETSDRHAFGFGLLENPNCS